jgi:hypothetical protein
MIRATLAALLLLPSCTAPDLLYEPRPDDPLDGYKGSLAEAGVNTEMDWGPKQEYLLSGYKALRDENALLQKRFDDLLAANKNLEAKVAGESEALQREKTQRVQVEAEAESLRQTRRELEARILSLGIEKAKLEQQALLGRIAELQRSLEAIDAAEPAAPTGGGR